MCDLYASKKMPIVFASLDVERTNFGLMSHTLKYPQWLIFEKQKRHLKNLKKLKSDIKLE